MSNIQMAWQDLRRGLRGLGKTPGFTVAAALTLSLGIGANAAIFSVINAVLLSPLPYAEPDRRVMIWSRWNAFDKTWVSDREVLDYRERCTTLTEVAGWGTGQANLTGSGDPIRVGAARVTANTFAALGAGLERGRAFIEQDGRPGAEPVVIIGHGLWQRHFGGDPSIVGRTILVDGVSTRVVGITPPGFQLPTDYHIDRAEPTQLYTPLELEPENRGGHGLYAAAELRPGATAAQASAELAAVTAQLTREGAYHPAMQFSAFAVPVDQEILGTIRPALLLIFGAVGFLLLIACANVANLLLARAEGRQREMAIRAALGASRWRLARQLLTEGLLLAGGGGVAGLGLAWVGVRALAAYDPAGLPRTGAVGIDTRVLAFAAVLALLTTAVFSLVPAWRASRLDLTDSLKEGGLQGTAGAARQRLRRLLVVVEMALAVVLLVGAGLMIRSLQALERIDVGFRPEGVLTLRLSLPSAPYDTPERIVDFYQQLLRRVRSLPGVEHAALIRSLPLSDSIGDWGLDIEGFEESPGNMAKGDWQVVSDDAVETLGEQLVRGRTFSRADDADAQLVAMINETMARRYWGDRDPIGGRIKMGGGTRPWITVVGVVKDVRHNGMTGIVKEKFYVPHAQFARSVGEALRTMYLAARTGGDPLALAAPIRAELAALDRNLPVADVRTMTDVVAASISTPRFTGFLLGLFAAIALSLSAIGIYGVLSYVVSQRTHEIGIRMAVGAGTGRVRRMVLGSGLTLSLGGIGIGLLAATAVTRLMGTLLYEVEPLDLPTFLAVPAVLTVVALLASYVPAWRATRVDPLRALRTE
jgi:putative ABC transport system permease protein